MESSSSALITVGALVPFAHFIYTLVRDAVRARHGRPRIRVFATVRKHRNGMGVVCPMKCVCVANVCGRTVSVAEIRTSPKRGVGVVAIGGGRHEIAPGGSDDFPLPPYGRPICGDYCGDVFVELGTGDLFSAAV